MSPRMNHLFMLHIQVEHERTTKENPKNPFEECLANTLTPFSIFIHTSVHSIQRR